MNEDQLLQLLQALGASGAYGGMPGKTAANKLNYYQDLISTLGFDPVQQAGVGDPNVPDVPDYQPSVNKMRFTYESDPVYKQMFDLIDHGASPATAVTQAGIKDPNQAKEAQKIAADYASEVVDEMNARQKYDQTTQKKKASYTAPDGSKYKNAPLGGNDVFASSSEYDLLGQPTIESLLPMLKQQRLQDSGIQMHNTRGGPVAKGAGTPAVDNKVRSAVGGLDPETNMPLRRALQGRIEKAKRTQVRSDANTNAMRRVLALRTIIG